MIFLHSAPNPISSPPLRKLTFNFRRPSFLCPKKVILFSSLLFKSNFKPKSSFKRCCIREEEHADKSSEGFSILKPGIPWDSGSIWSTMGFYLFSLHIPLSFGGLSVVANVLHQPILDPQTEALSLLAIETLELIAVLWLLRCVANPGYRLVSLFQANELTKERNWLLASALGFGFLMFVVFFSSLLADQLIEPKDVNNPVLKQMLSSGFVSETACVLVYCLVTPLLEEIVYRGFLLTSLASTMKWHQAVFISSAVFSTAHFSGENFLQLFIIGCVLGCSYCWSGNLNSSFVVHSLYNAMTLLVTFLS